MIQINEQIINRIINETINEAIFGNTTEFSPSSPEDREQNFKAITNPKNIALDNFHKWREEEIKKGRDGKKLSWDVYKKETNGGYKLY